MHILKLLLSFWILFASWPSIAHGPHLVAGPMLGYTTQTETLIWLQTEGSREVTLQYYDLQRPKQILKTSSVHPNSAAEGQKQIDKFLLKNLKPGHHYAYRVRIDGQLQKFPYALTFKTQESSRDSEVSFLVGSCAYLNDPNLDKTDNPYGDGTDIFKVMAAKPADFMLWMGDNLYLRPSDYTSPEGIAKRYALTRAEPDLQALFASKNHYAIWDDHDYGPNDSNKSYELKTETLRNFKEYWANSSYGQNGEGIYSKFTYADLDFFLLDDRSFRDDYLLDEDRHPAKTVLGEKQKAWLKASLLESKANFKFIVVGSQFLNEYTDKESFNYFKKERAELQQFLTDHKITGVFFLSGDRHHTELLKKERPGTYSLYELTASPLSSRANNSLLKSLEASNPQRQPGTLIVEHNFCKLKVHGKPQGRSLLIECFNKKGDALWAKSLENSELR